MPLRSSASACNCVAETSDGVRSMRTCLGSAPLPICRCQRRRRRHAKSATSSRSTAPSEMRPMPTPSSTAEVPLLDEDDSNELLLSPCSPSIGPNAGVWGGEGEHTPHDVRQCSAMSTVRLSRSPLPVRLVHECRFTRSGQKGHSSGSLMHAPETVVVAADEAPSGASCTCSDSVVSVGAPAASIRAAGESVTMSSNWACGGGGACWDWALLSGCGAPWVSGVPSVPPPTPIVTSATASLGSSAMASRYSSHAPSANVGFMTPKRSCTALGPSNMPPELKATMGTDARAHAPSGSAPPGTWSASGAEYISEVPEAGTTSTKARAWAQGLSDVSVPASCPAAASGAGTYTSIARL
mmetsp:Transcript_13465/g.42285  ORF Transcript_13465/g.42285 Transcript_13465/m.42285 type:complete len:354 (-) Transcript_13465:1188-2249(-)